MKYTTAIAAAFVAGTTASFSPGWAPGSGEGEGWGHSEVAPTQSWVTEVLTAYTTYCPEATEITHGGTTYSVTEATTLTITGPATVTYPVTVTTTASPPPPPPYTTPVVPVPVHTAPSSYSVPVNGTAPPPPPPSGTAPPVKTSPIGPVYTGAASVVKAGSAGLAAVFGLVAYAL